MKKLLPILIGIGLMAVPAGTQAAKLTGDAVAKMFGIMTMDELPGVTIADFDSPECDDDKKFCLMDGFSWSDVIGWTIWGGQDIGVDVIDNGGNFTEEHYAKMAYNGSLGGYIWSEKTGWIQLSSCLKEVTEGKCNAKAHCQWGGNACDVNPNSPAPAVADQNSENWGVFVDFCSEKLSQAICEAEISDPYCNWEGGACVFDVDNNPQGEPLRGYAWSKHLGWIKFGEDLGDQPFGGVFANWQADETPPQIEGVLGNAWIPNSSPIGTIVWEGFATEQESGVNVFKSDIDYELDPNPGYVGCFTQGINDSAEIQENGTQVDLLFPQIGQINSSVQNGHCKYELNGVIYNDQDVGYFFGSEAKQRAADAGVDVDAPEPHFINASESYLFTLAGEYSSLASGLFFGAERPADGIEENQSIFLPSDVAGNPIVNIPFTLEGQSTNTPDQMVRNVYIGYNFDASQYFFDSVNPVNNILNGDPAPLLIGLDEISYPESTVISYPKNEPDNNYYEIVGGYGLNVKGLAPTINENALSMLSVDFETNSQAGLSALPPASPVMEAYDLVFDATLDEEDNLPLPFNYSFTPALEVASGSLSEDEITLEEPLIAGYTLVNNSLADYTADRFSIDHIFAFKDVNNDQNQPAFEIRALNQLPLSDVGEGRTDRSVAATRYQLWNDTLNQTSMNDNAFHGPKSQYHSPDYNFDEDSDGADLDGQYEANGLLYADPDLDDLDDPLPPVLIDRTDLLDLKLGAGETSDYQISFQPSLYLGEAPNGQIEFQIEQYVAYKTATDLKPFTIYQAPNFIDSIEVKAIGLNTDGAISGGQVFEAVTGRDLENVTLTTSADLRREMRRNIAVLTRNLDLSNCSTETVSPMEILPEAASDCVIVNEIDKTIVAVYSGGTLSLGNGSAVAVPEGYRYTLILMDGANLYLSENLYYQDTLSSLGIAVMQDVDGNGGNVYLNPQPTNMVGYLYAEGSLLSSANETGEKLYYTEGGPPVEDLKNQLYWQGSVASRNTIGGAPGRVRPAGVDCEPWSDVENCSQAYDLDFLRRFDVSYESGTNSYFSPPNSLFSGGGSCTQLGCSLGSFATTINLIADFIDPPTSKSLDTFYIERDNRKAPPGFSHLSDFTSQADIR